MSDQERRNPPMGAITFPDNNKNLQPIPNQPSQPHNLQGLLRFATEITRNEDASGSSPMVPMDEERRKFLDDAISSLTVDMTSEMQMSIDVLSNKEKIFSINCDADVPDDVIQAFDTLTDIVINLDMSVGFYKLGGYKVFPVCLSCENGEVRVNACQLLAEISQNNPFCQSRALESGFVHTVLNILRGEDNERVLKAALYAASCLVREHDACAKTFLAEGGSEALTRCIRKPANALRNKAAFLLCHIYPHYPELKVKVADFINALSIGLKNFGDDNPGHLLNALRIILTSTDIEATYECIKPELGLKKSIEKHMEMLQTDMFTEEMDDCKDILKVIALAEKKRLSRESETNIDR